MFDVYYDGFKMNEEPLKTREDAEKFIHDKILSLWRECPTMRWQYVIRECKD